MVDNYPVSAAPYGAIFDLSRELVGRTGKGATESLGQGLSNGLPDRLSKRLMQRLCGAELTTVDSDPRTF